MIQFDWNEAKAKANFRKHGVSFEEARTVFFDDYARQFFDEEHSDDEERFLLLGVSSRARILMVCHCEREQGGKDRSVIRIVSARRATAAERSHYDGPLP